MERAMARWSIAKPVAKATAPGPLGWLSQVETLRLMTANIVGRQEGDGFPRRSVFFHRQGGQVRAFTPPQHGFDADEWFIGLHAPGEYPHGHGGSAVRPNALRP